MTKTGNKKIRILIDAHAIGGEHQGSVSYIKGLYQAMINKYSDQYEFFFAGNNYQAMRESFPQIAAQNFLLLGPHSRLLRLGLDLPWLIAKHKIDFAHFQYLVPFIKNCKFIVTTHDLLFNDFTEEFSNWYRISRNLLFRKSLERSDIRLTVSNYSKEAIHRHYGILPETIHLTPNAVRSKFFEPYEKMESMMYLWQKHKISNFILYVSRIETRKNQELLLKTYCKLRLSSKGTMLVFIGNNTLGENNFSTALGQLDGENAKNVHWLQNVDDEDLLHFYRAAELFVYPSKAEGFGIPPLEAAAARIPTLCSNTTAMKDYDFFGPNLFDPNNEEEFKTALAHNSAKSPSPERLESIAQKVQNFYTWEHSAGILHQLIMRNRKTPALEKQAEEFNWPSIDV